MRGRAQKKGSVQFRGYDLRELRLPGGIRAKSTKELVVSSGWAATALIALEAGQYVANKGDCIRIYGKCIGDAWTGLLEEIHGRCRVEWGYLIPEQDTDRKLLWDLCERALGFENHFLTCFRNYLLTELRGEDESHTVSAAKRLGEIIYPDDEVINALRELERAPSEALRDAARVALESMQGIGVETVPGG
jgi:hypothetical protein